MRRGSVSFLITALSIALLSSCGGGGGGDVGFTTQVSFTFPTQDVDAHDSAYTVSGMSDSPVDLVLVNGVPAQSSDGFLTWSAALTLSGGANPIQVEAQRFGKVVATARRDISYVGENIVQMDIVSSRVGDIICVFDRYQEKVYRLNLVTHERVGVSVDVPTHLGVPLRNILYLDYDPVLDRALVLDRSITPVILSVDFSAGTAQNLTLPPEIVGQMRCFVLDQATHKLFVFSRVSLGSVGQTFTRIYTWDPTTAEVDILSDENSGSSLGRNIHTAVIDHIGGQIYAFDDHGHNIVRIDLASGQRSLVGNSSAEYIDRLAVIDNGLALACILRAGNSATGTPSKLDLDLQTFGPIAVPTGESYYSLSSQGGDAMALVTGKLSVIDLRASGPVGTEFALGVGGGANITPTGLALDPLRRKLLTPYFARLQEIDLDTGFRRTVVDTYGSTDMRFSAPAFEAVSGRIIVAAKSAPYTIEQAAGLFLLDPNDGGLQLIDNLLYGPDHRLMADPLNGSILVARTETIAGYSQLRFRTYDGSGLGSVQTVPTIATELSHGIDLDPAGRRLFVIGYDSPSAPLRLFEVDLATLVTRVFGPPAPTPIDYAEIRALRVTQGGTRLCLLKSGGIEVLDLVTGSLLVSLPLRGLGEGVSLTDFIEDPDNKLLYASIAYGGLANGVIVIEPSSGSWHYLSR